jgi:predicted secreted protein
MTMRRLVFALALLVPGLAFAQGAAPGETLLTLRESAERELPQDRLVASLRVEATAPTAAAVQAEVNRRKEAAVARAKTVAGVRVETQGYWTHEERPAGQPRRWRGQAGLQLSGTDAAALLALAGGLQENGLAMSGMRFELTPAAARAAQDELTAEALVRLRARGDKAAEALGLRVTGLRHVRVGDTAGDVPRPRPMMRAMAAQVEAAAPVAEPGTTAVRVEVEADLVLAPK